MIATQKTSNQVKYKRRVNERKQYQLWMKHDLHKRLSDMADKLDCSMSYIILSSIRARLDQLEKQNG